ncbi:unnamed protein product [Moneuplotes crassus]|uniref:Uncharacterized protein n=1 Tax=Euplotes crassus TaxID=5936 RepID=A0AAD1XT25_EUPCR|nr:unnamed protein product [Moneuplotes crassus]
MEPTHLVRRIQRKIEIAGDKKFPAPRKRNALSPEFHKQFSAIPTPVGRNLKSPDCVRSVSPLKTEVSDNGTKKFNYKDVFNSTYVKDTRKEFESYLEKHGGKYNPGFSQESLIPGLISNDTKEGWSKFAEIIKKNPLNENVPKTIKFMKGRKFIVEAIMNSKHKNLLLQNENVLKFFCYNKLVSKQNESYVENKPHKTPTRHETKDHITNLINNPGFIRKLQNKEFEKMKQTEAELRIYANGSDKTKAKMFKKKNILKDVKTLGKEVNKGGAAALARTLTKNIGVNHAFAQRTITMGVNNNPQNVLSFHSSSSKKRGTHEVISQLVNFQREQKKEEELKKRGNNYDSNESESESDGRPQEENPAIKKRGVVCISRIAAPEFNTFEDISETQSDNDSNDQFQKTIPKQKVKKEKAPGFTIHSTNKAKPKYKVNNLSINNIRAHAIKNNNFQNGMRCLSPNLGLRQRRNILKTHNKGQSLKKSFQNSECSEKASPRSAHRPKSRCNFNQGNIRVKKMKMKRKKFEI